MEINEIWSEIEEEHKWRLDEIRFFSNQLPNLVSERDKNQFRRAMVLILYAHFEGFCKFAFLLYIKAINKEKLLCKDVNNSIAAASLSHIFHSLRNTQKKAPEFKKKLPDDNKLHLFSRNKEFLENLEGFLDLPLFLKDEIVDTESNLKPVVLSKLLFLLGFDNEAFSELDGDIDALLNKRNQIAHGQIKDGIDLDSYEKVKESTFQIIAEIKRFIMNSLTSKDYLR